MTDMDDQLPAIQTVWDPPLNFENPYRRSGKKISKETYLQDAEGVYHAIGGFQRFVHTANEHPQWFFNKYMVQGVLLPDMRQEVDLTVHIHPALQRSALDVPYEDVTPARLIEQGKTEAEDTTKSLIEAMRSK